MLLFAHESNNRCKIMEDNKCSDMANGSWTYSSRCILLQEKLISGTSSWTISTTKVMPFKWPFNCLWWLQKKYIYENTSSLLCDNVLSQLLLICQWPCNNSVGHMICFQEGGLHLEWRVQDICCHYILLA